MATRELLHITFYLKQMQQFVRFSWTPKRGAGGRIRTPDLLITNQLLYQLSYTSVSEIERLNNISLLNYFVNTFPLKSYYFSEKGSSPVSIRGYIIYQKACGLQLYVHFGNHLLYGIQSGNGLAKCAMSEKHWGGGPHRLRRSHHETSGARSPANSWMPAWAFQSQGLQAGRLLTLHPLGGWGQAPHPTHHFVSKLRHNKSLLF